MAGMGDHEILVGAVDELRAGANVLVTVVGEQLEILEGLGPAGRRKAVSSGDHTGDRNRVVDVGLAERGVAFAFPVSQKRRHLPDVFTGIEQAPSEAGAEVPDPSMPTTRLTGCLRTHSSAESCPRSSLLNSRTSTGRPISSSAATASELLCESTPIATPILASFRQPTYDVTSGRTRRRWVAAPFYEVTAADPVPAGETSQVRSQWQPGQDMRFGVISGRFRTLSLRTSGHRRIVTPAVFARGAGWTRTSDQRIMKLLCQETSRRSGLEASKSRTIRR
jgi:hypothetical protein